MPIYAASGDGFNIAVTFDHDLVAGPLNPGNWSARFGNVLFTCVSADATDDQVALAMVDADPDPGPDVVSYLAVPADVIGLNTVPAAAFTNYPLNA